MSPEQKKPTGSRPGASASGAKGLGQAVPGSSRPMDLVDALKSEIATQEKQVAAEDKAAK
jgi:hypothetical protein